MEEEIKGKKKRSLSVSINESLFLFYKELSTKVIEVDGKKIYTSRTTNEVINRALEFAAENINEWA